MVNSLETYAEEGRKAAEARQHGDETGARFRHEWAVRAEKLEQPDDQRAAREAFTNAYRQESQSYQGFNRLSIAL